MNFREAEALLTEPLRQTVQVLRRIRAGAIAVQDPKTEQEFLIDAASLAKITALSLTQPEFSQDEIFFQAWQRVLMNQSEKYKLFTPYATYSMGRGDTLDPHYLPMIEIIRKGGQLPVEDGPLEKVPGLYYDPRWAVEKAGVFAPLAVDYLFYSIMQRQMAQATGESFDLAPVANFGMRKVVTLKNESQQPIFAHRDSIGIAIYNMGGGGTYQSLQYELSKEYPGKPLRPSLLIT